ncbi:L-fucose/L-arabinose isomerase family protein [Thaumasiovibrio sp. DFM-14]|uniref:L-fucose/L-arabinose isomerase family protein n=1 Tax=Thaumasiovibrio sp. DFM-14 TaxID=3384792 RepID=UPI0039A3930F
MTVNFLQRTGLLEQSMQSLVAAKAPRKDVPVGFIGIGFELHFDWAKAKQSYTQAVSDVKSVFSEYNSMLAEQEPIQTKEEMLELLERYYAQGMKALVVYQASYIQGDLALALAQWLADHDVPVLSWSHTETTGGSLTANRLCGQNFLLNNLSSMEVKYSWIFEEPGDASLEESLGRFIRTASAKARLKHAKLLMVGGMRVPGFYDCELNEMSIAKHFGLAIDRIDMHTIWRHGEDKYDDTALAPLVDKLLSNPKVANNFVKDDELKKSVRLALAIADFANSNGYIGVALKNWPELFENYGISGDGAGALVQDLGIPVADESDMGALLTMVAFNEFTMSEGLPTLMDFSYVNHQENKVGMWHCGGTSTKLLRDNTQLEIRNHSILDNYDPETSYGMLFEFLQETGPITIAKYQYPHASTIFAFEGDIVDSPMRYRGCYGEVSPTTLCSKSIASSIMNYGMDHHWVVARGHLLEDLREFNYWIGIEELAPTAATTTGRGLPKKLDF